MSSAKSNCDAVASYLKNKGIYAAAYHRGMKDDAAKSAQDRWMHNEILARKGKPRIDCIGASSLLRGYFLFGLTLSPVATIAFG